MRDSQKDLPAVKYRCRCRLYARHAPSMRRACARHTPTNRHLLRLVGKERPFSQTCQKGSLALKGVGMVGRTPSILAGVFEGGTPQSGRQAGQPLAAIERAGGYALLPCNNCVPEPANAGGGHPSTPPQSEGWPQPAFAAAHHAKLGGSNCCPVTCVIRRRGARPFSLSRRLSEQAGL